MDANNTPYFLLASEEELAHGSRRLEYHRGSRVLTLAQNQPLRLPASDPATSLAAWTGARPMAVDNFSQVAILSEDMRSVQFNSGRGWSSLRDDQLQSITAPSGTLQDFSLNFNGRLALPYTNATDQHGLLLFHLAKRWQTSCSLPDAPRRAFIDKNNRIWCITAHQLILVEGEPLPLPYQPKADRFEPLNINPHPLAINWQQDFPAGWAPLAICGDDHYLYILAHDSGGNQTIFRRSLTNTYKTQLQTFPLPDDLPFGIDLGIADPQRLALLVPQESGDTAFEKRDCPVISLHWDSERSSGEARLIRERYPMLSLAVPRFASSADGQLRYQAERDPDYPDFNPRPRELHRLRQPQYHLEARSLLTQVLDSGSPGTIWHRAYLDASIPPGCTLTLAARVFDSPDERGQAEIIEQPPPVWSPLPSELPFQNNPAGYKRGECGLFELLLQRKEGPVRRLTGRYLQLQVRFTGNGRTTPSLHRIRLYHPRFSYQEAYLPELYRQELSPGPGQTGSANGADVRERLLAIFEGMLTPIETMIGVAEQLINPDSAPEANLAWLTSSLGAKLPGHWPVARQRRWLKSLSFIQQNKGTLPAVNRALDIVTDGGVQRGEVVVVENFRLRRTLATILGRNMDDALHPLTLGTGSSGNSIIGESLILSDMNIRDFMALFAPELANKEETEAVDKFFDDYAHRISVLLHGKARDQRQPVREMLQEQLPAHLQYALIETELPFILGTSPLLGIDTYLETSPEPQGVVLNQSLIGQEGVLNNPAAFSPRDINAV